MITSSITSVFKGGMCFKTPVQGHVVTIDLGPEDGGNNLGTDPKILMLASLAGCTGVDVVAILQKMKVNFSDFSITVTAHATETEPKIYDQVALTYVIKVKKDKEQKVQRAVALSQEKYCGVSEMFRAFSTLSYTIEFLP